MTTDRQYVSNAPSATQTQTKGEQVNAQVELVYRGLGDYYNLAIPKSDASLLMGLTRNYLMLNGVQVTVPTDPEATAIVYVTVDVFGINRSRSDFYVYNEENVIAETAIEMFAFGREATTGVVSMVVAPPAIALAPETAGFSLLVGYGIVVFADSTFGQFIGDQTEAAYEFFRDRQR